LQKEIQKIIGDKVLIPDTGKIIALSLKDYLKRHPELNIIKTKTAADFYTTDNSKVFKKLAEKFLAKKIKSIKKIEL
ncbi:MAG: glutamate racemase, partial [Patescibacteria group bacterium]